MGKDLEKGIITTGNISMEKISTVELGSKSQQFRKLCDEAIQKADEKFKGGKNKDYNSGGVEITDYFDCLDNMVEGTFYDVYKKALRLRSLISSGNKEVNESKEDNCVDLINYTRFLYAALIMEKANK